MEAKITSKLLLFFLVKLVAIPAGAIFVGGGGRGGEGDFYQVIIE
jgi:hypothetical protein